MIDEIKAIIEAHTFAPYLGTHTYDNDMIPHLVEYFQGKLDELEREKHKPFDPVKDEAEHLERIKREVER